MAMIYRKPEISVLGKASEVVESIGMKQNSPTDGSSDPDRTTDAYDLDE